MVHEQDTEGEVDCKYNDRSEGNFLVLLLGDFLLISELSRNLPENLSVLFLDRLSVDPNEQMWVDESD